MSELQLGKRHRTEYGNRYDGVVIHNDRKTDITYREPAKADQAKAAYVLATGLFAAKASMRVPAHEGVKAGHITLALSYSNQLTREALNRDAADVAAAIDSLPSEVPHRVIALSKGGRVTTRALMATKTRVESATLVAAAGYILDNHMSLGEGLIRLSAAGPEVLTLATRHPFNAAHLGISCMKNIAHRPRAVWGEMQELRTGDEHETLKKLKQDPEAPYMRFMYGDSDLLLQASRQESSILGVPFDAIFAYRGRHMDLATNPAISRGIYLLDDQLETPIFVPSTATALAA